MENNNKMTKKDYFAQVRSIIDSTDVENKSDILAFIDHEVSLLNKKASKTSAAKAEQHETLKAVILEVLADFARPVTITEMMSDNRLTSYEELNNEGVVVRTKTMTNQKLSSMVTKLKKEGKVVKTEEKKVAYFSLA